jgi:hypothetical protein
MKFKIGDLAKTTIDTKYCCKGTVVELLFSIFMGRGLLGWHVEASLGNRFAIAESDLEYLHHYVAVFQGLIPSNAAFNNLAAGNSIAAAPTPDPYPIGNGGYKLIWDEDKVKCECGVDTLGYGKHSHWCPAKVLEETSNS